MKKSRKYSPQQLKAIRSKAMIIRNRLQKELPYNQDQFVTRREWMSHLMTIAWDWAKSFNDELFIIEAKLMSGKITRRVVSLDWTAHNTVKGTGRKKPEGLLLFVDVAKLAAGSKSNTFSAYEDRIIFLSNMLENQLSTQVSYKAAA